MRIDMVSGPHIEGKHPAEQIKVIADHCHDTAAVVMRLNNELESLKSELEQLKQAVAYLQSQRR